MKACLIILMLLAAYGLLWMMQGLNSVPKPHRVADEDNPTITGHDFKSAETETSKTTPNSDGSNSETLTLSREEKVEKAVKELRSAGLISSIDLGTHTIRTTESFWDSLDIDHKHTMIGILADYMQLHTKANFVYILGDRNDSEFGRQGVLGGVSVSR